MDDLSWMDRFMKKESEICAKAWILKGGNGQAYRVVSDGFVMIGVKCQSDQDDSKIVDSRMLSVWNAPLSKGERLKLSFADVTKIAGPPQWECPECNGSGKVDCVSHDTTVTCEVCGYEHECDETRCSKCHGSEEIDCDCPTPFRPATFRAIIEGREKNFTFNLETLARAVKNLEAEAVFVEVGYFESTMLIRLVTNDWVVILPCTDEFDEKGSPFDGINRRQGN